MQYGDKCTMNAQVKVSIIIPVYKGAEFLRRSFDSAIYQTLPEVEVIAVNDFSPNPRDAEIMREYEEIYPDKFHALYHDMNTRQGGARNTGIKSSKGDYFLCLDQDDYIDLHMCEKMYKKAKDDNAEIVICSFAHLSDGRMIIQKPNLGIESADINARLTQFYQSVVWVMLVNKNVVERNLLYFPVNNTADDIIAAFWYYAANRISRLDDVMYFHTDNLYQTRKVQTDHFREHPVACARLLEYPYYKELSTGARCEIDETISRFLLNIFLKLVIFNTSIIRDIKSILSAWNEYKEILNRLLHSHKKTMVIDYIDSEINKTDFTDIVSDKTRLIFNINMIYRYEDKFANKNIVIWGAGIRGKSLAGYLEENKISFEITDKNQALYNQNFCGKYVKPWADLRDSADIVIVSPWKVLDEVKTMINNPNICVIDYADFLHV